MLPAPSPTSDSASGVAARIAKTSTNAPEPINNLKAVQGVIPPPTSFLSAPQVSSSSSHSAASASRWGPKPNIAAPLSERNSPELVGTATTNASPGNSSCLWEPGAVLDSDVEIIEDVEWAAEGDDNELAPKPKLDRFCDPCGCSVPSPSSSPKSLCCLDLSCVLFACQEECRSNCEAGEACGNKRIQRKQWKRLQVFDAGLKGKGLRVLEPVQQGEFIVEYVGKAIKKAYLDRLFRRYQHERMLYIMALDTNIYIDARTRGGVARFINHSCQPNCVVERWKVRGILRAGVFATRDLQAGEELCFDYQWERKRGRAPTKCHCNSTNCRGTLEVPRSLEEQELEQQLVGHWKKPLVKRAGREIVNRSIKIFYQQSQEYFPADVCKYSEETKKHLVIFRHDLEEVWEDLSQEDWMILDEEAEQHYIIAKKKNLHATPASSSSLVMSKEQSHFSSPHHQQQQQQSMKNYLFIQTPIKEMFWSKHLIERCERNCGVTIHPAQFARPPLPVDPNQPEDVEKYRALDQSLDGTVWKLTVAGSDVVKALTILEKNVAYLEKKNAQQEATAASGTKSTLGVVDEVIIPRCVVDLVKKRLAMIREKCRSVNVAFAPSDSKSKQFARLLIEGTLQSDVLNAKVQLWQHLLAVCVEVKAPLANCGVPRDLGFLGGEITSEQFRHLFGSEKERLNQDANEDMRRSPFFTSFESTQRCTVWVQSEDDKGRIDGMSNRVVNKAVPNAPRKIFFGCDPKEIPRLWSLVETRAAEISRGAKYLFLGADRLYQQYMMQRGGQFFDYVERVTGASVTVDPMTGDHLRLDGKVMSTLDAEEGAIQRKLAEIDRVALAEEVIRLQIELFRDHCIRDQNWVFGRDWTLLSSSLSSTPITDLTASAATSTARMNSNLKAALDEKSVSAGCLDIADIAAKLNLQGSVAAHAVVILYRFATLQHLNPDVVPQAKIREIVIASLFLANKAQKIVKWKRLSAVLEAAYQTYYPGTQFDRNKEEVLVLEDRVIAAELEILSVLSYDVCWRGVDWIIAAAIESGQVAEPLARNAFNFAVSGPVLAAGATVWLKYGPEYVFTAAAGFLSINIEHLFTALSLIPLKVSQAAELIATSIKFGTNTRKAAFHDLLNGGKQSLLNHLPHIKDTCIKSMSQGISVGAGNRVSSVSESQQRFQIIGSQLRRRRAYLGVDSAIVRERVMPITDGISAESTCRVFVDKSETGEDLVLEGSWRAIAIAEHLLEAAMKCEGSQRGPLKAVDLTIEQMSQGKLQAKCHPGLLQMGDVQTSDGWSGTIQAGLTNEFIWGRKTGGKCCVAAKLQESSLRQAGLRWWIPPRYGPSTSGSICEMFFLRSCESHHVNALQNLTKAFVGQAEAFPMLSEEFSRDPSNDRHVAVSIQRWPSEKVAAREQEKTKDNKEPGLQMGFSAAALQELQLLTELHGMIQSPLGHPNFMLPFGIAIPSESAESEQQQPSSDAQTDEDIFSLFRTSEENERAARKQQKHKDLTTGPHLIFQPTPFVLQRFLSKKKIRDASQGESSALRQTLIASWFHDLLSGLVHCHANSVVLRSLQADQVVVDHAGVAKLGGLYRATVFMPNDLEKAENHDKRSRSGSRKDKSDDEDCNSNPYVAPENLLGSMKHNKQTDVWSMGCLLAHLLLGKPLFVGRDRESLLLSVYKVVGTPSKDNFSDAAKFPHFSKLPKKYKRGVEKAIMHMMNDAETRECMGAIDLVARMLHLDPKKRISAVDALKHHYMLDYLENCNSESFQREFVKDWLALKEGLLKQTKLEEDEAQTRARSLKRKADLIAASQAMDHEDDLYDMDELVVGRVAQKSI